MAEFKSLIEIPQDCHEIGDGGVVHTWLRYTGDFVFAELYAGATPEAVGQDGRPFAPSLEHLNEDGRVIASMLQDNLPPGHWAVENRRG
jgi:hypothetical protein